MPALRTTGWTVEPGIGGDWALNASDARRVLAVGIQAAMPQPVDLARPSLLFEQSHQLVAPTANSRGDGVSQELFEFLKATMPSQPEAKLVTNVGAVLAGGDLGVEQLVGVIDAAVLVEHLGE